MEKSKNEMLKTPIKTSDLDPKLIKEVWEAEETKTLFSCFQCGMCTSSCPITEIFPLDPHQITRLGALGVSKHILNDKVLRFCLTCRTCQEYCPQNVDFIEFIKLARRLLINEGIEYEETHDGILNIISQIQASRPLGFKASSDLVPNGYKISKKGKIAYFFGCLPILDVVFDNLNLNLIEIAQNAIKILNKVCEEPPVIIDNIKCCGHDALWKGQFETFKRLAEHNVSEINKLGIETIITTCAECYRTLKVDYPKYVKNVNFNVIHLSELIADKIKKNQLKFSNFYDIQVTYHDPCRLGRHMKVYTPPREILTHMKEHGVKFNEMERNSENSPCCGVSCFINCNDLSKALQLDRLIEAKKVADVLVTTCSKCQIHYKCMLQEKKENASDEIKLKITDLTNLIAKMMGLSENKENEKINRFETNDR
jgi:heterodisulfide reductase subunit D